MKTNTGLFIVHDGKRVNVYTLADLRRLEEENLLNKIKRFLGICTK